MFLHFHEFIEIIWFRTIAGDVTIDKEFYPLDNNLLCFIPSFNVHEFRLDFSNRIEYYIIQFDPELFRVLGFKKKKNLFENHYLIKMKDADWNRISMLCNWYLASEKRNGPHSLLMDILKMMNWFSLDLLARESAMKPESVELSKTMHQFSPFFAALKADDGLTITLDRAAYVCGMSKSYFSRLFKKAMGMNFSEYMEKRKISTAAMLLSQSEETVTEAGYKCGFNDTAYFCKVFKKHMNITPNQMKKSAV
jgi:AraC-like DNA-binding protein